MWIDKHRWGGIVMGWLRETVSLLRWFKSLTWSTSSLFPLANHLALPGSESLCYKFRVLSCLRKSLSQDEFRHRGLWEGWHHLLCSGMPSFWLLRSLSAHVQLESSLLPQEWEICNLFISLFLFLLNFSFCANKCTNSQSYGFFNSHVWMWEMDHKERWAWKT